MRTEIVSYLEEVLADVPPEDAYPTTELIHMLEHQNFGLTGQQFASILRSLSTRELSNHCSLGEPEPGKGPNKGKLIRRTRWHEPRQGEAPKFVPSQLDLIEAMLERICAKLDV